MTITLQASWKMEWAAQERQNIFLSLSAHGTNADFAQNNFLDLLNRIV